MKKSEIKNSAQLFLYKAIVDFNSAKCLYEVFMVGEIELDLEKIYFDLQQCAEKLLKSLLTNGGIIIPKTHDIEMLIKLLATTPKTLAARGGDIRGGPKDIKSIITRISYCEYLM